MTIFQWRPKLDRLIEIMSKNFNVFCWPILKWISRDSWVDANESKCSLDLNKLSNWYLEQCLSICMLPFVETFISHQISCNVLSNVSQWDINLEIIHKDQIQWEMLFVAWSAFCTLWIFEIIHWKFDCEGFTWAILSLSTQTKNKSSLLSMYSIHISKKEIQQK